MGGDLRGRVEVALEDRRRTTGDREIFFTAALRDEREVCRSEILERSTEEAAKLNPIERELACELKDGIEILRNFVGKDGEAAPVRHGPVVERKCKESVEQRG